MVPKPITFQPDIYEKVLSLLKGKEGLSVLDVGAGEGYFCQMLKELGYQAEACDFMEEDFKASGIPFHRANLNEKIPCEDNKYDVVVSIEVIEHLENHFQFMRELFRVVKPGGVVIVTTPNTLNLPGRLRFLFTGFDDCAPVPVDPHGERIWMEHINSIGLPELLFHVERNRGEMLELTTNRIRSSAWLPTLLLYPFIWWLTRKNLFKKKYKEKRELFRRQMGWLLKPANLMGRITIVVAQKK